MLLLDIPIHDIEDDVSDDGDRHDSGIAPSVSDDPLYGLTLLRHVKSEMESNSISQNIMPVAFVSDNTQQNGTSRRSTDGEEWTGSDEDDTWFASRLLDYGAMDVLSSPFTKQMAKSLSVHCYRVARESQRTRGQRKRSWVGVEADLEEEEKERKNNVRVADGYAYLREKM